MPRGNRTNKRGRGRAPGRIIIPAAEGTALRQLLADRHGYSVAEALPALLSGELATVLLGDEERRRLLAWCAEAVSDLEDELLRVALLSIARQLEMAAALGDE